MRQNGSGFWSGAHIKNRSAELESAGHSLIKPKFEDDRVGQASYRLALGDEIYISPATEEDPRTRQILAKRESKIIPSGQFAFLITAEEVSVPLDAIAFIALRSKETTFRGLVNVSGFHVDPGYSGRIIFSVFNAGPGPVQVTRGDHWFEIFFADLVAAENEGAKKGYSSIPSGLITPLAKQFQSFAGIEAAMKKDKDELSQRLHSLEREQAVVRWAAIVVAGALLTLALRPTYDRLNDVPREQFSTASPDQSK
ncbi:dCTP deaminase domain-containing protein [Phenylobacterium sp.]|uniref:dCTP deaminase domain-containing protein n=1 Tax=Phenylobacterium sp. TaxID=1871053 RepID=UPI004036E1B7